MSPPTGTPTPRSDAESATALLRQALAQYSQLSAQDKAPSPCISVCTMDEASGLCSGCLRTLDEIAAWSTMAEAGKRVVWERIAQRINRSPA